MATKNQLTVLNNSPLSPEDLANVNFKITPEMVNYRDGNVICARCQYFAGPTNECDLLEDTVSPHGSCEQFVRLNLGDEHDEYLEDFMGGEDNEDEDEDDAYLEDDLDSPGEMPDEDKLAAMPPETEAERNEEMEMVPA